MTERKSSESKPSFTNAQDERHYSKNYSLIEKEDIEGTPFTVNGIGEKKEKKQWCITMGQVLISPMMETKEECLQVIAGKHWNLIINVAGLMAEGIIRKVIAEGGLSEKALDTLKEIKG